MARLLSRTFQALALHRRGSPSLSQLRRRSSLPDSVEVIELDIGSGDISGSGPVISRIEDAIHGFLVRRAAPDWLPFVPGASYWAPPMRRPHGVAELVGRLTAAAAVSSSDNGERDAPADDQVTMFTKTRGWPSHAYFFKGDNQTDSEKKIKSSAVEARTDDDEN